jgi:uncharacterized protein (TIGR02996 family)
MAANAANANLSNPELEARILEDPNDIASYLVYGDWLSERGDPRGELIAVQAKLHEIRGPLPSMATIKKQPAAPFAGTIELDLDPTRKLSEPPRAIGAERKEELENQERALLDAHHNVLLGSSLAALDEDRDDLALTWRLGFVDGVRFGPPLEDYETTDLDFAEMWTALLEMPHLAFLREVVIGSKGGDDDYPASWGDIIETMAGKGIPNGVQRLTFDCGGFWDISSTELGDLQPLYPKLRGQLRALKVRMGSMGFGPRIDLPLLESLEIVTGGLTNADLAAIAASSWPNLERLSICIGQSNNDYGCDVIFGNLYPIVNGRALLPRVRHLGLCNSSLADQIAHEIASSAILPQLESLDLSKGTFGDEGARAILANASAFTHLAYIDLSHHYVSDELQAQLVKIFGAKVDLSDPQDGREDEGDRYCEISE